MPKSTSPAEAELPLALAVIEDDPLVRHVLCDILRAQGWAVADYDSAEAFIAAPSSARAACLLLDAKLPGISGLELLARLRRTGSDVPVIVITGATDIKTAVAAMHAGAEDFIEKPIIGPELISAVQRIFARGGDAGKITAWHAAAAARVGVLTARQRQVMSMVLAGQPNKNIAADLGISQRTVENHRAKIMRQTQAGSLPELARLAMIASWPGAVPPEGVMAATVPVTAMTNTGLNTAAPALPHGQPDDDQFRRFFDAVPMAIVISAIAPSEIIIYANPAFQALSGQTLAELEGKPWSSLRGVDTARPARSLGQAIAQANDLAGSFALQRDGDAVTLVDAYVSVIIGDDDQPAFRMAALVGAGDTSAAGHAAFEEKIREKDTIILEIQHRVKNNLQMITSLIRVEARNAGPRTDTAPLDRLEGRINSIQIIYRLLSDFSRSDEIDLGVYLSEIAASVMHSHAMEGIRLDMKLDSYPVSVNVALPTGLVANELLTNDLKHAFVGRENGTITLHSLTDARGCRVTIADDGVGLPDGVEWPRQGKLGQLIVRSLRQNAKAELQVNSAPGKGTKVTIAFSRAASSPAVPA